MSATNLSLQKPDSERKNWFVHDRFGMIIHFGLYSLHTQGAWYRSRQELPHEHILKYFNRFNPDLYDPGDWARRARNAGMTHMTLTSKHHDGFCLWPTGETDFNVSNTPYGRDLIGPFVEACRAEGLKVGLYYSLIDWSHRDFAIDPFHPLRNIEDLEGYNAKCDVARYQAFMKAQVTELLTQYGEISHFFPDFSYPRATHRGVSGKGRDYWDSEGLLALVRELQPNAIVNNRLDLLDLEADFYTPECFVPHEAPLRKGRPVDFESAFTMSERWSYNRDEQNWKSPHQLIRVLVDMVSMGGNLMMNVGPTGRGILDQRTMAALDTYANWMELHARSICGCGRSPFQAPKDCRLTQNGNRVYVHLFSWPYKHLYMEGLGGKVAYAQLLNDASEITWLPPGRRVLGEGEGLQGLDQDDLPHDILVLQLPPAKPPVEVPVIELVLK